jgi:hypothetical protein
MYVVIDIWKGDTTRKAIKQNAKDISNLKV